MRVADYIFKAIKDMGVDHLFLITGGGAMFLNDAAGRSGLKYVCNHHEQACTMAAEGYARMTGLLGVASVTTGPGGINAMNGLFGAWTDSVPMLVISGQVKKATCLETYKIPGLRQLGDQEADIIPLVESITKYSMSVHDPKTIRYHLEKAIYLATHGRKGPCWIDVPIDVQSAEINPDELEGYTPDLDLPFAADPKALAEMKKRLLAAKRPLILTGNGVRIADRVEQMRALVHKLGLPAVTSWTSMDQFSSDDPLYFGRTGQVGDRSGNFALYNCDFIITLGSRLNIRQVSYEWANFAPNAYRVQVDIDQAELDKPSNLPNLKLRADVSDVLDYLEKEVDALPNLDQRWRDWGVGAKKALPTVLDRHRAGPLLNPYLFMEQLSKQLDDKTTVVTGNGAVSVILQAMETRYGQRYLYNSGCASMGYDLPAALGAAYAEEGRQVVCLAGDGSMMMNIQEWETLKHSKLPVKLFIMNNEGYLSIRQTQDGFFDGFRMGSDLNSGLSFPDFAKLAEAWGLPARQVGFTDYKDGITWALDQTGPCVVEVMVDPDQVFEPKLSSKQLPDGTWETAGFDQMWPFLEEEELAPWRFED